MIILMGECSQSRVSGDDVLNIPDHVVDELRNKGACTESADLCFQEIHLICDILSMDDTFSRVSCTVQIIQGSAVNQILKLRLDSRDLIEEQLLVLMRDTTFQFIGY